MIEVIATGIQSSIQDLGRFGFRKYGIPVSGAMDRSAMLIANQVVGNPLDAAGIEFLLKGPILKFNTASHICISGAEFSPKINNQPIPLNTLITVNSGDQLNIGSCSNGMYGYLAISGGLNSNKKYGSRSQYEGITSKSRLQKGETLPLGTSTQNRENSQNAKPKLNLSSSPVINVYKGPEFDLLESQTVPFFNVKHKISSEINRMGYRLESNVDFIGTEILTAPVQPGTIQLTPSGKLIVLMRDAQTTGGYSRILQLDDAGISFLAQRRVGEPVLFELIQ